MFVLKSLTIFLSIPRLINSKFFCRSCTLHLRLTKDFRDAVQLIDVTIAGKERLAGDHLSKDTAGCPDVDLSTVSSIADKEFWRAIPPRCYVIGARFVGSSDVSREAKVAKFDYAVRWHQHVLRLYIAMHDLSKGEISLILLSLTLLWKKPLEYQKKQIY